MQSSAANEDERINGGLAVIDNVIQENENGEIGDIEENREELMSASNVNLEASDITNNSTFQEIGNNADDDETMNANDVQCQEVTTRIGNTLHVVYPMANGPLPCTETFCTRTVRQKQWSHRKAKLITHLKNAHHILIDKTNVVNWCSTCSTILHNVSHIRSHMCLVSIPQILTTTEDYDRLP